MSRRSFSPSAIRKRSSSRRPSRSRPRTIPNSANTIRPAKATIAATASEPLLDQAEVAAEIQHRAEQQSLEDGPRRRQREDEAQGQVGLQAAAPQQPEQLPDRPAPRLGERGGQLRAQRRRIGDHEPPTQGPPAHADKDGTPDPHRRLAVQAVRSGKYRPERLGDSG